MPGPADLPDAALDAATRLFWERGYQAASVEELVARTGLHRAAIYGSHGSKRRLYEALLRRYRERVLDPAMEAVAPLDASLDSVRSLFAGLGERALGPEGGLGCLMVLAGSGPGSELPGVARIVEAHRAELRSRLARALRNAQLRGEVRGEVEPGAAADFLAGAWMGLMALARSPAPRQAVQGCARGILDWLDRIR
jgi:TetR/AcrR family transcriptional repressor of nem operon